ncbi:hypothetical protein [Tenacibaculum maritimum]|uniref:hypothetical protein n=1 Tax=Tenacibaculum maritimum TaxID=107401 RepID=UPI003876310E
MKLLKIFIYSVFIILIVMACASTKNNQIETSNKVSEVTFSKQDSVQLKTVNQSITDTVFLPIETGNSKIDSVIEKRLTNFKTYKKSGDNSYKITYNKISKGFDISSKIGRTENSLVKKNDSLIKTTSEIFSSKKNKVIIRYRVPSWLLLLFGIALIVIYFLARFKII